MKKKACVVMVAIFTVFLIVLDSYTFSAWGEGKKTNFCLPTRSVNLIAPFVAQKKGFFQAEDLEVELIQALSNICISGLIAKSFDYTTIFGATSMTAALRGLPVRGVMAMHNGSDYGLMARKGIRNFKELRGLTVGVSRIGTGADFAARFLLEKHGLAPDRDVKISPLGSMEARISALDQGLVGAAIISMPAAFELEKKGYSALIWGPSVAGLPFINGVTTTSEKIKTQPNEVKKVIRSILKATKFIREERQQTIVLMMQWMRINKELAEKSYDVSLPGFSFTGDPDTEAMKAILEQAKREGGSSGEPKPSQVVDFSLLKEVQSELGIAR
jgi:ABC-type nitrate/sulfonate/bicarbonate transport system substrate-binding protein